MVFLEQLLVHDINEHPFTVHWWLQILILLVSTDKSFPYCFIIVEIRHLQS